MNKSYLLIALVAVAAIIAVVLVVFKVINVGGCPEGQTSCGAVCCQPDETCQDGTCQTKPGPDPTCGPDQIVCHLSQTISVCCEADACHTGDRCCSEDGKDNVWCHTTQKCCARNKCDVSGNCCDDKQVACGSGCCDPLQCSSDNVCCRKEQPPCTDSSGSRKSCCDVTNCNTQTGECCTSGYDPDAKKCIQTCGKNADKKCPASSTCFSTYWNATAAKALYPMCSETQKTDCIADIEGDLIYFCLSSATCPIDMSSAIAFPPQIKNFKPAYVFDAGKTGDLPGIRPKGTGPDCFQTKDERVLCAAIGTEGHHGELVDLIATELPKDPEKVIQEYIDDVLDEPLRETLQSPLGYRCVGSKPGWRWLFKKVENCSEADARQACMKANLNESNVTRVAFDPQSKMCVLEKCVGDQCQKEHPLRPTESVRNTAPSSLDQNCSPDEAFQCPTDTSNICPPNCFDTNDCWQAKAGSGGWQLWKPGSDKLNICATHCHSTGLLDIGEHIRVVKNVADPIVDSGGNTKDDLAAFCAQVNAFDWYADGTTATLQQVEHGSWTDTDTKGVSMRSPPGSQNSNGGKYKSGSSNDGEDICTPFNDGPYSSNLFFHSNDVEKGSVEDIPNCKVHCAN